MSDQLQHYLKILTQLEQQPLESRVTLPNYIIERLVFQMDGLGWKYSLKQNTNGTQITIGGEHGL